MNRYVLFLLTEPFSDNCCRVKLEAFVENVVKIKVADKHRLSRIQNIYASLITLSASKTVENGSSVSTTSSWRLMKHEDGNEKIKNLDELLSSCPLSLNNLDAVRAIHDLADTLPRQQGLLAEIFWFRSRLHNEFYDDIEVYGCLKRLQLCYNALINIILPDMEAATSGDLVDQRHFDSLRPTVLTLDKALDQYTLPVWSGSIVMTGSSQSLRLSGFRMDPYSVGPSLEILSEMDSDSQTGKGIKQTDMTLSSSMKFVATVDLKDVPLFYISSSYYRLSLTSQSEALQPSNDFLRILKDNHNICYILRLDYGLELTSKETEKETEARKSWNDFLNKKCEVEDCMFMEKFDEVLGSYSFLLHAVPSWDLHSNSSDKGSNDFIFLAYRLRNPSVVRSSLVHELTMSALQRVSGSNVKDIPSVGDQMENQPISVLTELESLPCFSTEAFQRLDCCLRQIQVSAIQNLIDEREGKDNMVSGDELAGILSTTKQSFLKHLISQTPQEKCRFTPRFALQNTSMPEFRLDPYHQLERQLLVMKSSESSQINSSALTGTLASLSPPTHCQATITLDAGEMRKFFNTDGTAADKSTFRAPVRKSRQRHYQYDNGEKRLHPWPDCSESRYHDVYYNTQDSEELEKKTQKLKSRLGLHETSSTFSYSQPIVLPVGRRSMPASNQNTVDYRRNSTQTDIRLQNSGRSRLPSVQPILDTSTSRPRNPQQEMEASVDSSLGDSSRSGVKPESRSQRNKRKLEEVVKEVLLTKASVDESHPLFGSCFKRLYTVSETYVRDLTTSRGLKEAMTKIAKSHVLQTVKFEKERAKKLLMKEQKENPARRNSQIQSQNAAS